MPTLEEVNIAFDCYLFSNTNSAVVKEILRTKAKVTVFKTKSIIYNESNYLKAVGIILEGNAVIKTATNDEVVLKQLRSGEVFGVATMFTDKDSYVSEIVSKGETKVMFLDADTLERLFKADYQIVKNYISFLTDKIHFLNRRIDAFTAKNVQLKIVMYIMDNMIMNDVGQYEVILSGGTKQTAEMLNVGRASFYRVLDDLAAEGILAKSGKTIKILNVELLNTKY